MKLKLFIGNNAPDSSYQQIGYKKNIDSHAAPNEADEICAPEMLDFLKKEAHENYILHLISKLRHGGKLVIGGTDIISIALGVFNKTIRINEANILIYGSDSEPTKVGLTSLEEVRSLILQTDLKITKQIPGTSFLIEAIR